MLARSPPPASLPLSLLEIAEDLKRFGHLVLNFHVDPTMLYIANALGMDSLLEYKRDQAPYCFPDRLRRRSRMDRHD